MPISWLREHASAPIKWRTVNEILPPHGASAEDRERLRAELMSYRPLVQIVHKQKANGTWGDNILGVNPSTWKLLDDGGTVARYRRLLEFGAVPNNPAFGLTGRTFRLAERVFFRLLSRDEAPELAFEFRKAVKADAEFGAWVRGAMREAVTAALAQAGQIEDPRVRGSAHRIASEISQFLRSELADKPLVRRGNRTILHPEAHPPTVFSVDMVAYMPTLQRERAGFVERLAAFLGKPAPTRPYVVAAGKRIVKPVFLVLGDPIEADSAGHPKDLPLALHWIETLVRLGALRTSETAQRVLARLLAECDDRGVWAPKNLRALPKSASRLADFAFPLEVDGKTPERRQADVTFRLALIAKLAGWRLEFV